MALSPNDNQIVSVAEDKQVKLWDLDQILIIDPIEYGCHWIGDYIKTNTQYQLNKFRYKLRQLH